MDEGWEGEADSSIGMRSGCRAVPIVGSVVERRTGEEMTDRRFGSGEGCIFFGDIRLAIAPNDDSVSFCGVPEEDGVDLEVGRFGSCGGFLAGPSSVSTRSSSPSCCPFAAILALRLTGNGLFRCADSTNSTVIHAIDLEQYS